MTGIPGQNKHADYRAIGAGVAITPSVSVVNPAKNGSRYLEHAFDFILGQVNRKKTSCPRNISLAKGDIEELRWN